MSYLWSALLITGTMLFLKLPNQNVITVVCAILPIGVIQSAPDFKSRIRRMAGVVLAAAFLQFTVAMSAPFKMLLPALPGIVTLLYFLYIPDTALAAVAVVIGWLAIDAPPGWLPALDRGISMLFSAVAVLTAVTIAGAAPKKPVHRVSCQGAFRITLVILLCAWLEKSLHLPQGNWLVLTVTLLYTAGKHTSSNAALRAVWTPAGLVMAFLFMADFTFFDYRFAYILPLWGAFTFILYEKTGNYGIFCAMFMAALALYADISVPVLNGVNMLFMRFFNTLLASVLVILFSPEESLC